ncbi:L-dopachrome tautomerase-related protein [Streptomyces sp. AK02-01A]|uniref:L-dopachrome tautomerase-related protein n=1 Tax=Streptomyces sp. AK02-01A TaxID=3028648 RepID=UPI0029A9FD49|nr:L-dopachrome tautomerase-related protein [Streptomyces sp. AK02-01A]MDX3852788.1 L-dopachrome tautomerase-related protein [Streptomyces sp. AK02-01A]
MAAPVALALLLSGSTLDASTSKAVSAASGGVAPERLESVAAFDGAMPTGVTISRTGRIFVNFPHWGDKVRYSVAEIRDGKPVAYPNREINVADSSDPVGHFLGVQSVVVDAADRLWVVDTGRVEWADAPAGGPKLVAVDLRTNKVIRTIVLPAQVAGPLSFINDVRFDLTRGKAGTAYLTDASTDGPNGLVVVDLATGESRRRLNNDPSTLPVPNFVPTVEGQPLLNRPANGPTSPLNVGADGIALSPDGKWLYYCPLSSRTLYAVSTDALTDFRRTDAQVASTIRNLGTKGMSDGLETDSAGRVYGGDIERNSLVRRETDGQFRVLVHDDRLIWPDTLSVGYDHYLYVMANQLNRQAVYHGGVDLRRKPYMLYRLRIDSGPARR